MHNAVRYVLPYAKPCITEAYGWLHLDTKMAQDIVARTMRIIDTNINVMDARGRIIGSGDRERIGELHEGALLVLSQGRVVDIDDAVDVICTVCGKGLIYRYGWKVKLSA